MTLIRIGYAWRNGARVKVDADIVGAELERLQDENGVITTGDVVAASEPEAAPLHPHFEWDDAVAADRYRDDQARYLLRSIVPLYADPVTEEEVRGDRLYIAMRTITTGAGYDEAPGRYTIVTQSAPDHIRSAAWAELKTWIERYGDDPVFAPVVIAIKSVELD